MSDHQIVSIAATIRNLICGIDIRARQIKASAFRSELPVRDGYAYATCGALIEHSSGRLWFELPGGDVCMFDLTRNGLPFSRSESRMLNGFPDAVTGVLIGEGRKLARGASRLASHYAFEHLMVAMFLRGKTSKKTMWVPAFIVSLLQDLAFQRYEGKPCTSGVVFASQPEAYITDLRKRSEFEFEAFQSPLVMGQDFYSKPASFRYVDGRNAFYLVDNWLKVYGIVRLTSPGCYTREARVMHEHLTPLTETSAARTWVCFVGDHDDVNLVKVGRFHARWLKSHWHLVEQEHLADLLLERGLARELVKDVVTAIFSVSDLRRGTTVLVPDDEKRPPISGRIDDSTHGDSLLTLIQGSTVSGLAKKGALTGVLTSDGLTTVSSDGRILGCGEIINLTEANAVKMSGGGRTQAARAASRYGIAIKVSEDGPITVYRNEQELLRYTY
jgi:hypothetical protein